MTSRIELGVIEGFYGRPWSWTERAENVDFLATHGYAFFLYAPKADPFLRRRWRDPHPPELFTELASLATKCRSRGVRFGIGLSPYDLHRHFDADGRAALLEKLAALRSVGIDDLGILFDDMRGDVPRLADTQLRIVEVVAQNTSATRIIVCPSYYSDDPVLDRVFGARPERYLETLGHGLDQSIQVFWTGEEVCAREISIAHVRRVADQLRRRPFLWDNYPVNDGQRMSQFLHLRGFTGRPAALAGAVAAHGVNPALQPTLSRIPLLTLAESYRLGTAYAYGEAFARAAVAVAGPELGRMIREDLLVLQDVGLDRLGERGELLRARYQELPHPAAREIIAWLDGEFRITDAIVETQ